MIKKGIWPLIIIASFMIFSQNVLGWITTRLTWSGGPSLKPVMAVDSSKNYYVFYADETPGNYEIFFKKSTDSGTTWTTRRLTWNAGTSQGVDVTIDTDDNIHLVWMDTTPRNFEIFYKNSTDGGSTWSTKQVSMTPDTSMMPAVVTDLNKNIHVFWHDNSPGNNEIFYAMSTDSGTTWATKRLTWNPGISQVPEITAGFKNIIHVVWSDNTPVDSEVYYKWSADGGASWTTERLTWNTGNSNWPFVLTHTTDLVLPTHISIIPAFIVHVLWDDSSPGNVEIFHKYK